MREVYKCLNVYWDFKDVKLALEKNEFYGKEDFDILIDENVKIGELLKFDIDINLRNLKSDKECVKPLIQLALDQGLHSISLKHLLTTLETLFFKLGLECGLIKRVMIENDISWGYFFDHCPFQPHCNSHPNNFLVWSDTDNFLAPLDFDFCYEWKGFISTIQESATFG